MKRYLLGMAAGLTALCVNAAVLSANEFPRANAFDSNIDVAIGQIDVHVRTLMERTKVPGLAVAVVHDGKTVFQRGYGIRNIETGEAVTPDTVFQLASVSKPVGATVVASVVGEEKIGWDTPIREIFPWFRLADPWVSANVTVGDLYAHRSGLPDHAGDDKEQLDYSQRDIFESLALLPSGRFRQDYAYTNYGLTLAAEAVAARAGKDWATLSQERLYSPLGMASTSSRYADFLARPDRASGHVLEGGKYVLGPDRSEAGASRWSSAVDPARSAPAASVSSSVNDMARWMAFMLASGTSDRLTIPGSALAPALTPKALVAEASEPGKAATYYGYGFLLPEPVPGHRIWTHSGAFAWGAGTNISLIPQADTGIVVLVNATPNGVAETIAAQFVDMVLTGAPTRDWWSVYEAGFATILEPQGRLVNAAPPDPVRPPRPLSAYAGTYENAYFGPLRIEPDDEGGLLLKFGAQGQVRFHAKHRDADTFMFAPFNDSQLAGSLSAVDFAGESVTIEAYDEEGLGTFTRTK